MTYSRCSEFDSQWNTVHTAADIGYDGNGVVCESEAFFTRHRSVCEQCNRWVANRRVRAQRCRIFRYRKRLNSMYELPLDSEGLPRCRKDANVLAVLQELIDKLGHRVYDMLAVIEN